MIPDPSNITPTPHPDTSQNRVRPTYPTSLEMIGSLGGSLIGFARSGFVTTDAETLATREAICNGCEMWDAKAMNGTGRCRTCGCSTWAKLRMATEKCPIGKW